MADGYVQAKGHLIGWVSAVASIAGIGLTGSYPMWLRTIIGIVAGLFAMLLCFGVDAWCNWEEIQQEAEQAERWRYWLKDAAHSPETSDAPPR